MGLRPLRPALKKKIKPLTKKPIVRRGLPPKLKTLKKPIPNKKPVKEYVNLNELGKSDKSIKKPAKKQDALSKLKELGQKTPSAKTKPTTKSSTPQKDPFSKLKKMKKTKK